MNGVKQGGVLSPVLFSVEAYIYIFIFIHHKVHKISNKEERNNNNNSTINITWHIAQKSLITAA